MFTLRQLRYFDILARTGHFGQAAEQANISQPALSVQIAEMEKIVGSPLFERHRKGIILTPLGRELLTPLREVLASMTKLNTVAQDNHIKTTLRLGIIPTVAPYILPAIIPSAQPLSIHEAMTPQLVQMLANGELDAIIAAFPLPDEDFQSALLFHDRFYLATAKNEIPTSINLHETDINATRLILLEEGHCLRSQTLEACHTHNYRQDISATSLSTLLQLVTKGIGITFIPEIAIATENRHHDFHITAFASPSPARDIHLFWRRRSQRQKEFTSLSESIAKQVKPQLQKAKDFIR